jgi:hypothetical protein
MLLRGLGLPILAWAFVFFGFRNEIIWQYTINPGIIVIVLLM